VREREVDVNFPSEMDNDRARVAARPARRSFWSRLIHWHLREWLMVGAVVSAVGFVMVNALFLQPGPHPAPIFANRAPVKSTGTITPDSAQMVLPRPRPAAIKADLSIPNTPAVLGHDPIGNLISPARRVAVVQQVLAEYGYGQIRATGTIDPATRNAIAEFERNRKLPVTGQISERLTRELAAMTGRPLD
jgi:Putative peptidoglycan binding domain